MGKLFWINVLFRVETFETLLEHLQTADEALTFDLLCIVPLQRDVCLNILYWILQQELHRKNDIITA